MNVGVDGGVDAVRREIYREMDPALLPDFVLPLNVVEQGYRVVYEPEAILREEALHETQSEYRMRVRVSLRAFHALWHKKNLFNFPGTNFFAAAYYNILFTASKIKKPILIQRANVPRT